MVTNAVQAQQTQSIARQWNEQLLAAIRLDEARPTVHARNLYHTAVAMWDAWAAYAPDVKQVLHQEKAIADDIAAARHESISYAAYRLLQWRFKLSPNVAQTNTALKQKMERLGYDIAITTLAGNSPAALGNRVAQRVIEYGLSDGANEQNDYASLHYQPVNARLDPAAPGNPNISDPNRWQQLHLPDFVGQSGQRATNYPPFVGPEWGNVRPFSLEPADANLYTRDGAGYRVYLDPGPPPRIGTDTQATRLYKQGFEQVIEWSAKLDPNDGVYIDISPESRGNNTLGTNDGNGYEVNPVTGLPYQPQLVKAGDYYRVLAEFWADGPSSETPPGHWFTLFNVVSDQPALEKKFAGKGRPLSALEWDVRGYLTLGGGDA